MCDVCADRRMKSILGVVNVWLICNHVYASTSQFALFVIRNTSQVRGNVTAGGTVWILRRCLVKNQRLVDGYMRRRLQGSDEDKEMTSDGKDGH